MAERKGERISLSSVHMKDWDESKFESGLHHVQRLFDVREILEDQKIVLKKFFQGNNVYFSAPTGFGKSLVFQSLPLIADCILDRPLFTSIVLVVCPLQALMVDQVKFLRDSVGLNAAYISKDTVLEDITECLEKNAINILYASPESMLSVKKWRNILSSENFKENCVAVVIDEAHCTSQW